MTLSWDAKRRILGAFMAIATVAAITKLYLQEDKIEQCTGSLLDYGDTKKALQEAYTSALLPFQIPQEEKNLIEKANADTTGLSSTYGEITIAGSDRLLEAWGLTAKDVFYDLGSGRGQFVLQAALSTPVGKSIGIELSPMRNDEGLRAFERIKASQVPLLPKRVELRQGDILKDDWTDATAIYFASALMPKSGVKKVTEKVLRIPRSVKIASLKRLPQSDRLRFDQTLIVGATWYPTVAVHLYHTIPPHAVVPQAPQAPRVLDPREVSYLLQDIYFGKSGALALSKQDQAAFQRAGSSPLYGEILPEGAHMLFKELDLKKSDVVVDLGSGIGKFALQTYLATPVRKVVGIELAKARHQLAMGAKKQLFSDEKGYIDPNPNRTVELLHKDFLKSDLSEATVLYACSAHFSSKVLQGIVNKALENPRSVTLVVFNKLPKHKRLRSVKQMLVPTSWSDAVALYIYQTVAP